jgi:hypothetical protein
MVAAKQAPWPDIPHVAEPYDLTEGTVNDAAGPWQTAAGVAASHQSLTGLWELCTAAVSGGPQLYGEVGGKGGTRTLDPGIMSPKDRRN